VVVQISLCHGVLHNYGGNSFFQKDKSFVRPKLWFKSILLYYESLLEIKSCLLEAVFEQIFQTLIEKNVPKVHNSDCYKIFTFRTLSVGHLCTFAFCKKMVKNLSLMYKIT